MGKAYSEEEKIEIKKRLWEEGIKLFHEEGAAELNIRELTKRAGISLGSFYNFYTDKATLTREIMNYRAGQKLDIIRKTFGESLKNPKEYLINIISSNFNDMSEKVNIKGIYKESFTEAFDCKEHFDEEDMNVYISFLDELATYWNQNGYKCKVDSRGIVFTVLEIINMNKSKAYIPQAYLEVMINDFLVCGINRYVTEK